MLPLSPAPAPCCRRDPSREQRQRNSYNGSTFVHHTGAVTLGTTNGLPTGSTLILGEATSHTGGKLDLNGYDQSVAGLSSAGTGSNIITNNALAGSNTFTVTGGGTFAGTIQDGSTASLALTKGGTGIFALTGASIFTGATTVNGGTLLVNGSLSGTSSVLVEAGGILGGTGTIAVANTANITVNAGGALAPGAAGAGTLTLVLGSGQLDLTAAGNETGYLQFELGTISDRVALAGGSLNIGGGLDLDDFSFTPGVGFGPGTYVLFDSSSDILGTLGANTSGSLFGYDVTLGVGSDSGGQRDLVLTVVPEPGASFFLLSGLGAVLTRRRRHHSFSGVGRDRWIVEKRPVA